MRAVMYRGFGGPVSVETVDDPACPADGVVVAVHANGLCRSDWHGWLGHDPDISLPHVPGHELAGVIVDVGAGCTRWHPGDRVTAPFVLGCGTCPVCRQGQHQVCGNQRQPGFSDWGAFADYVAIPRADTNLVALPDSIDFATAASLGCRFTTAFRAVIERGRLQAGEWLAVHGCGGLGLSAIMIGRAAGAAGIVAVDIDPEARALARDLGASVVLDARTQGDVAAAIRERTGGAHVSIDALGHRITSAQSLRCLRIQGRHVQAGLLAGEDAEPPLPMAAVIGRELEILGTHGMAAHRFPALFDLIAAGRLEPGRLLRQRLTLDDVPGALMAMDQVAHPGITVMIREPSPGADEPIECCDEPL